MEIKRLREKVTGRLGDQENRRIYKLEKFKALKNEH